MTVVCLPPDARAVVGESLPAGVQAVFWDAGAGAPSDAAPERLDEVEFWVPSFGWKADDRFADVLARMPRLQVIQLTSAGYDHLDGRVPAGIRLCNGRGIHGGSTAEWVLAVILASMREIPRFVRAADEHRWDYTDTDELQGKRVVIVGAGDLGQHTARRVRAFDAEAVLVARTARDGVHPLGDLPGLLPTADVVVIVVPRTAETVGMVDAEFLSRMRDGALLVNAARGPIVDTTALLAELAAGRLHAALDVTDPEPLPPEHPLWDAPNLIVTPHVAGSVYGFRARAYRLVMEQITRFAAGDTLVNVVNR